MNFPNRFIGPFSSFFKPSFIVIAIAALLFTASGCDNKKELHVTYLYPSSRLLRFEKEGKYMVEHLRSLGVKSDMVSADDNDAKQIEQGLKALDEGADMLIISAVNGNTIAPLVREAQKRGIPVMAYNRLIANVEYDLFFTGHNKDNGRLFCEKALLEHPTGNYVILAGDRFDRNGVEQKQAIDSILKPHIEKGNINIVFETYTEAWSKANAMYETEAVLNNFNGQVDVIIAGADPMSEGVVEVLKKYGLNGKVFVTGQDAELSAIRNINNGDQQMTIYHPHKTLGKTAAELALKILKGEKAKKLANGKTYNGLVQIPTYQVKSVVITKENIEKELVSTGEYTWSQITNQ